MALAEGAPAVSGYSLNRERRDPPPRLVDILPPPPTGERSLRVSEIKRLVAEKFKITLDELDGPGRHQKVARPRHVAFWICRNATKKSLPMIGREFSGRDHTAVIHGVQSIDAQLTIDIELWEDVRDILAQLDQLAAPNEDKAND
jgi:chromosomal replication initiation ATPase DnaA